MREADVRVTQRHGRLDASDKRNRQMGMLNPLAEIIRSEIRLAALPVFILKIFELDGHS
mgnify:CR=1 FL=1